MKTALIRYIIANFVLLQEGTNITVGQVVPGGAAADDGRLHQGDEIIEIGGKNVEGESHAMVVQLMQKAAASGHVKLVVRRPKTGGERFPVIFSSFMHVYLCYMCVA